MLPSLTLTTTVLTSYHNHIQPTKNPSQSPSSSPTEICPGGIVPPLELAEGCVTSFGDDLNSCFNANGSPDEVTLSSDGVTKICGKASTIVPAPNTEIDEFVFSLNQGGIRVILNIPGSTFKATLVLRQVFSASNVCGLATVIGVADSGPNSGFDPFTGIVRYVPDKLDGSADYIVTASGLAAGTYVLEVFFDFAAVQPSPDLSCSATGGGLPYTVEVEEDWVGPTV